MPADIHRLPPLPATSSDGFLLGLESLMRRSGQGRHLAATVVECDGVPDLEAIRRAAGILGHRYPILHSRMARGADFVARWRLDEAVPAAIPVTCWHLPGLPGEGGETASVETLIARCLNGRDIDIHAAGPNLNFHIVVTSPATWSFVLIWSHSLHDAVGIDKLLREIATLGEALAPCSGGLDQPPAPEPMSALYQQAKPMIDEMHSFPVLRIRSLHRKGVRPGESRFQLVRFDRETTAAIRSKMAATAGELLLLPYFATCAARSVQAVIAARHPDEKVPVLLTLPVQRQKDPAKRPLFQNHMVPYTLLLPAEDLGELKAATRVVYRKYADFMRRKLPAAMDALMRLMERCPSRFYNHPAFLYMKGEICTLFHSHTGTFAAGLEELFGSRVLNGYHIPSVCSPPGAGVFLSEFEGQLSMTLSWKDGCLSPLELELLKQTLAEDLGAPVP